jgi:hypothetical protein
MAVIAMCVTAPTGAVLATIAKHAATTAPAARPFILSLILNAEGYGFRSLHGKELSRSIYFGVGGFVPKT